MGDRKSFDIDQEAVRRAIRDIMAAVHDEADPHELNEYKKMIRANTSVFTRSYLGAYLLKMQITGGASAPRRAAARKGDEKPRKASTPPAQPAPKAASRAPAKNDDLENNGSFESLFFSIGRRRRVFPRDLVGIITSLDGITSDHVGAIKIMDNYSFVEVDRDVSSKVIEHLDGSEVRGRKLTVNRARRKEGDE